MKLIAAFVSAVLLVPTAAWADNESKSRWADDGSTSRRINLQGMITAVDFQRRVIRVQEESGRRWLVLVRAETEIAFENQGDNNDEGDFPAAGLDSLQVGDMVGIEGLRLGNRRILALTLLVESQRQGVGVLLAPQRVVRGVVVAISNRSFTLVLQERTVTVVVQSATQFIAHQRPATLGRWPNTRSSRCMGKISAIKFLQTPWRWSLPPVKGSCSPAPWAVCGSREGCFCSRTDRFGSASPRAPSSFRASP